jgi:hypothetical protein
MAHAIVATDGSALHCLPKESKPLASLRTFNQLADVVPHNLDGLLCLRQNLQQLIVGKEVEPAKSRHHSFHPVPAAPEKSEKLSFP